MGPKTRWNPQNEVTCRRLSNGFFTEASPARKASVPCPFLSYVSDVHNSRILTRCRMDCHLPASTLPELWLVLSFYLFISLRKE